jgi:peptide deformylase
MALREILTGDDPILREHCREVTAFDIRLGMLLDDMAQTLCHADGLGLAAPQVGVRERAIVINNAGTIIELVNPVIIKRAGEQQEVEGCLSVPGVYGITKRPMTVKVRARNRRGRIRIYTATGLMARAFCHEIDHLDGVLFTDKVVRLLSDEELKK